MAKSESKTKETNIDDQFSELAKNVAALSVMVNSLVDVAHICKNCKKNDCGVCEEMNRPVKDFSNCSYFVRD